MSNPKRLLILCNLVDEELSVNELAERVGLAQSPLSQHLSKLRAMKLVATRRDGQSILYRLASDGVARVLVTLHGIYCAPMRAGKKGGSK
jgi:DNA-binding transcriptional ArsR family regulator